MALAFHPTATVRADSGDNSGVTTNHITIGIATADAGTNQDGGTSVNDGAIPPAVDGAIVPADAAVTTLDLATTITPSTGCAMGDTGAIPLGGILFFFGLALLNLNLYVRRFSFTLAKCSLAAARTRSSPR